MTPRLSLLEREKDTFKYYFVEFTYMTAWTLWYDRLNDFWIDCIFSVHSILLY